VKSIARAIDERLNDGKQGTEREFGFVLLLFPFKGGTGHYITNANKADMITVLRHQLEYFESEGNGV